MNTNEHEQELQELKDELSAMREQLDLLKSKLEGENILTEELLIAPVIKERSLLEKDYVVKTIIGPLVVYPLLIAVVLFAFDWPTWWRVGMVILLAVLLYGGSILFYVKNKKKYYSNNIFGMLGNTVEELEQYCHKELKNTWLVLVPILIAAVAQLITVFSEVSLSELTWSSVFSLMLKSPFPILLPLMYFERHRRKKRLRTILNRIEELRSGLHDDGAQ